MVYCHLLKFFSCTNYPKPNRTGAVHFNLMLYHCLEESNKEIIFPSEWYEKAFLKIGKLSDLLSNVDFIDGRLVDINNDSTIVDDHLERKMRYFKSLARVFIGSPSAQQRLKENIASFSKAEQSHPYVCFGKPSERESLVVDSLTKVSNFLNVSAQQRKSVRLTISPQVTEQRIWAGALEETLNGLKSELDSLDSWSPSKGTKMGQQIVSSCLKFINETAISHDLDSASWMRLAPSKVIDSSTSSKWEDVLEMFTDLLECMKNEKELLHHLTKIEIMREGLSQIKDVLIDKSIGYKEARHQEILVQKKLSKTLGHSSKCLFTLLLYYLFGHVRDIEVDLCGGIGVDGSGSICHHRFLLCMGRILTSDDERMVLNGVKQLDRALGLFKFVWETAEMKGVLELQGHLWCGGADDRVFTYKENTFFLHRICVN